MDIQQFVNVLDYSDLLPADISAILATALRQEVYRKHEIVWAAEKLGVALDI